MTIDTTSGIVRESIAPSSRNRPSSSGRLLLLTGLGCLAVAATGCSSEPDRRESGESLPSIVVSHAFLGAVTSEIVGDLAEVVVLIPNGIDPHGYEASAKDIETLNSADLVVVNGLGLEASLDSALDNVRDMLVPVFEATDHIAGHEAVEDADGHLDGSSHDEGDVHAGQPATADDHEHSEGDPHFWTDPRLMAEVVEELGDAVADLGLDIGDRALMFSERLLTFDQQILELVESLPEERRVLVTGHESLGYFAERYGFEIIGTIIPGLTSGAEVSAKNLADVKAAVERAGVGVVFTELGTPSASARLLSDELGVDVVEISTHLIPEEALDLGMRGDTYLRFVQVLVETIVSALSE